LFESPPDVDDEQDVGFPRAILYLYARGRSGPHVDDNLSEGNWKQLILSSKTVMVRVSVKHIPTTGTVIANAKRIFEKELNVYELERRYEFHAFPYIDIVDGFGTIVPPEELLP